jgi:hypothetical protein
LTACRKVSSRGDFIWLKAGGSAALDFPKQAVIDGNGQLIVGGITIGQSLQFGGMDVPLSVEGSSGEWSVFLLNYALLLGGSFESEGNAVFLAKDLLASFGAVCGYVAKMAGYMPDVGPVDTGDVEVVVFPNPSAGDFTIRVTGGMDGALSFSVHDALGRAVIAGETLGFGDHIVSDLGPGVWMIRILGEDRGVVHELKHVVVR